MAYVIFDVDLNGAGAELERLQHPPVRELEGVLLATFARTEARVHIITGKLLASGRQISETTGDVWSGTLSYARDPGIFELARGDKLTGHAHQMQRGGKKWLEYRGTGHGGPGDSHFFFDDVQAPGNGDYDVEHGMAYKMYVQVIEDWLGMP